MSRNKLSQDTMAEFGLRLKTMRKERGITQRWLAREAGLTAGCMSTIENGKCCPTAMSLERLADVFGVTMDELWRGLKPDRD